MKKLFFLICLSIFLNAGEIRVAAAANISYPLQELLKEFNKKYPDIKVDVNLGASGGFNAQIKNGANYDVFMAANMGFAQDLEEKFNSKTVTYTQGRLLLFSPKKQANLENLKTAECIAVANPKTAPYGKAAMEVLSKIKNSGKIVQATSISATLSQTLSACEFGFIAGSSASELKKQGYKDENFYFVPDDLYTPILQGMILLSKNEDAKKFYDFILSDEAKAVFKKYGYK